MENLITGAVLSFIVTFYAIPVIIQVAKMKKLFDLPDARKIHTTPIPSLGGLGIFAGFLMGFLLMSQNNPSTNGFQYYLASFLVIFFFGIKDDILVITPMKKFFGQLVVAFILMFKANLLITDMHGFLSITKIDPILSYGLTLVTIIVIMNAYNLIDGVDGLAGMMGVITTSLFSIFFLMNGDVFYAIMGFCFVASLFGFLIYNFSPSKIFMGDTGSMLIGLINAILVIHFIDNAENSHILPMLAAPAMGFGILLIPLLDTLRVFSIRIFKGRSPFSPDRNHLHHLLLDKGLSHTAITISLSFMSLIFIVLTYSFLWLGTTKVILLQIFLFFVGISFLRMTKAKEKDLPVLDLEENYLQVKIRNIVNVGRKEAAVIEND